MNVNGKLRTLKQVTGYPVEQDLYEGAADKYIVFVYEDERAALQADNTEQATIAYLNVSLFVPKDYNYFEDKKKIKEALTAQGFCVESIQQWLEKSTMGTEKVRRVTFNINITE